MEKSVFGNNWKDAAGIGEFWGIIVYREIT